MLNHNFCDQVSICIKALSAFICIVCCSVNAYSQIQDNSQSEEESSQDAYYGSTTFTNPKGSIFKSALVKPVEILEDIANQIYIEDLLNTEVQRQWIDYNDVKLNRQHSYWLKTRFIGNDNFKGEQLFFISAYEGLLGFSYGIIETYTVDKNGQVKSQLTGYDIPPSERVYDSWASLIKMDISPQDTLQIYLRMENMNYYHPFEKINLWHLDKEGFFTGQAKEASRSGIFYGILGIQCVFFILLFLIEREIIHFYYALFVFSLFINRVFQIQNFARHMPFPYWMNVHEPLYFISVLMLEISGILFLIKYFKYPKTVFTQRVIPFILTLCAASTIAYIFRNQLFGGNNYPPMLSPSLYTIIALFAGLYLIISAKSSFKHAKALVFFAFFPVIGVGFLSIIMDGFLVGDAWVYRQELMKIAILILIITLAVIVGYRTNQIKLDVALAMRQNFIDQQIITENEIESKKLKEINELKTKLYTNITHEFRTPLTVILGMNEELGSKIEKLNIKDQAKGTILKSQQLIQRNSQNLLQLVNQLLELAKSDKGLLELKLSQNDVIPYLNYLTESFYSKAREKNIRLVFYPEIQSLFMDYDELKLQQVIFNLLSNALKFTNDKGKIILHAQLVERLGNQNLVLKITDNGVGIPKDKLDKIFNRFYQIESSNTRSGEGTGIGLSLTKDLVQIMNGTITVKSEVDNGSSFVVTLPITQHAPLADRDTVPDILTEFEEDAKLQYTIVEDVNVNHLDQSKPSLLLVEDNLDVSQYIQQILKEDYQVTHAKDGEEGLQKAWELIPDMIISDVMMPKLDGFELTSSLREDTRSSHIPIILLTAKASDQDKIDGLSMGADAYINKPFHKKELLIRVEKLLESRKALQLHYSLTEDNSTSKLLLDQQYPLIKLEDVFIENIKSIIYQQINNPNLNTATLCSAIGLSQAQLYRKLKAVANETPNSYIRKVRLQKAKELLETTDLNVAEIAYDLGFNDPNYFSRVFHKQYGKSPMFFRK